MRQLVLLTAVFALSGCATFSDDSKERADLHMQIGTSYYDQGDYASALKELLEAEKLDPKNALVENNIGLTYFMREKYDLAEKSLRKALEIKPTYSDARNNLGRVLVERGKYAEAEDELKKVIADLTYSGAGRAWTNVGLARFNQKNFVGARDAFSKAVLESREDCIANAYYGRTFFELGDYTKAAEALDRAVSFCQRQMYDEPHYYAALAWYRLGDKDRAYARLEQVSKLYAEGKYRQKARAMMDLIKKGVE